MRADVGPMNAALDWRAWSRMGWRGIILSLFVMGLAQLLAAVAAPCAPLRLDLIHAVDPAQPVVVRWVQSTTREILHSRLPMPGMMSLIVVPEESLAASRGFRGRLEIEWGTPTRRMEATLAVTANQRHAFAILDADHGEIALGPSPGPAPGLFGDFARWVTTLGHVARCIVPI